jgi:hypothetical protein
MKELDTARFDLAAEVFPLSRTVRTSPGYGWLVLDRDGQAAATPAAVRKALETDPGAADLWYHLARLALRRGDKAEYDVALEHVRRLVPHMRFEARGN